MKRQSLLLVAAASSVILGAIAAASAQGKQGRIGSGMMQGGMMGSGTMMGHGMRQGRMGSGMMHSHYMMHGHHAMHHHGMMQGGRGQGMMMRRGMMRGGMGSMFGRRVVRLQNLSVEDVRRYFAFRLERIGNKRLKVGEVKAANGTITADIVTVDDSLVQRLEVDRRTGAIRYKN
ncbi:MAG: hypothetical protein OEQ29_09960 [Alphaproteobacteria bacterium]|nr:hypothetical protein [Alphaproteobacteria bacterium]